MTPDVHRSPDAAALAENAAERFVRLATEATKTAGRFSVALTGGSSPRQLYALLAEEPYASRIPWDHVHLFWGDERAVRPAHPRSNFGMANRRLLSRVPIPRANVHRIRGELGAGRGARYYEAELREFFGASPRFDLVHLGLGANGHILSLFPFDVPALTERERWVLPSLNRELGEPRITLTVPLLDSAARIEFIVPAREKARIAHTAAFGPLDPFRVPAQLARPHAGAVTWLVTEQVM